MGQEATPTRQPYTGSCHCGAVKYILYLTLPHDPPPASQRRNPDGSMRQIFYRCNCTTCHKAGLLHIRLPHPPDDFLLLAPLDPLGELGDYQCFRKAAHFLFCKTCGVRCFTIVGEGELVEKVVGESGEKRTVWCPKKGWVESPTNYFSVNGYTLDAGQEGLDLRDWTEKKWLMYADCLQDRPPELSWTYDRPFPGGAY
ncbi:hypothetical protein QBC33DRAFT_572916 [Phialemonium atrogriseum]|uniref:CENP-V/GFA domain-containing protein n=1 Tax=Phialemonium atrogriseum TaxID=1093897 RepID=A0AAJ0BT44_9PEZI|nr:uncharacterized protein QBC33DRAFT_572916 [Phialemonium atrogriseum]KAK1763970.1 hypothetical protein QBC33DRAFT_572916 [Phialemonium atrogriseum]